MERLCVVEGEPISQVGVDVARRIRTRLFELKKELKPRLGFVAGGDGDLRIWNLVGVVQISPRLVVDIRPKTDPGTKWASALVDLLTSGTRAELASPSNEAQLYPLDSLPDALAQLYADQLLSALRREGPLIVMQSQRKAAPRLSGRLDVGAWLIDRTVMPTKFPQHQVQLTADNPFTAAMAWVAEVLATRTGNPRVAAALMRACALLRPGLPAFVAVDPGVALRNVPAQWQSYAPPWETARAVLRRASLLHRDGHLAGLGLAVEPWPLLETLLHRSLRETAVRARSFGYSVGAQGHSGDYRLRTPTGPTTASGLGRLHKAGSVNPDGVLWFRAKPLATFEAKYSVPSRASFRSHVFQALAASAALEAPVAVLVYPEDSPPVSWHIHGFGNRPMRLVALGLDLYGYRRGDGERKRGEMVYRAILPTISEMAAASP